MVIDAKVKKVAELRARIEGMRGAILADYRGLKVSDMAALRKALKGVRAEVQVVKNTLVRLAVRGTPLAALEKEFQGPISVTFCGEDIRVAAKELTDFARSHPALEMKCGVFDGKLFSRAEMERIARLPSREVLLAQLAGTLQFPVAGLARVLKGLLVKLVLALSAVRDQKSQTS